LAPGTRLTIVKWAPSGVETARYPAVVVESSAPEPWIEVEAVWTRDRVEVGGLSFEPGDTLREFFSAEHPFNAFAVFAPGGEHRGWYGNVTYPAFFDTVDGEDVLVWHDLYLDVVLLQTARPTSSTTMSWRDPDCSPPTTASRSRSSRRGGV